MDIIHCWPQETPILTLLMSGRWAAFKSLLKHCRVMDDDEIMCTLYLIVTGGI